MSPVGFGFEGVLGQMDKKANFKLLNAYFGAGCNFIGTSKNYQDEMAEMIIGEWAESRSIRDQSFVATKYTTNYKRGDVNAAQKMMYTSNNTKSMTIALHESLKKFHTSHIDSLYIHWWDLEAGIEKVTPSSTLLFWPGKMPYLGILDSPAWVVAHANQYAGDHALTPSAVYQGKWNVMVRDFEREVILMARAEGMAFTPVQQLVT